MTTLDIAHHRLYNQQISHTKSTTPDEVVAWLGAIQAQDYPGAKWSIALRLPNGTDGEIEQAIADKTIIRTWPMRGTLHFVAAADIRWMLALLTPRIIASSTLRHQRLELDEAIFARCKDLFTKALQGDKQLTRDQMYRVLEQNNISPTGQRGYHILWRSAQEGLICFSALRDKQQTFALLDEWAPNTQTMERDQALAELAKRYFTSRGPATLQDFVWWSGLKVSDARAGLAMINSQLVQESIVGQTYWMPNISVSQSSSATIHLLPGFDEYVLGYKDRSAVLNPMYAAKICPGNNGMFMPTIVINGRIVGTWKRTLKKHAVVMTPIPFTTLTVAENHAFSTAASHYGTFLDLPVSLP
jgi:hypothetical protein